MKKTLAIVTLILFAFNAGGYLFVFKFKQYQLRKEIKNQIKEGVSDKDLTLITLDSETIPYLEWKNKHEFLYQGQMYDVVRKGNDKNGNILLYCISDAQETLLFAGLNNLVNQQSPAKENEKSAFNQLFKLIARIHVLPEYKMSFFQEKDKICSVYRFFYKEPALDIKSPPPKFG